MNFTFIDKKGTFILKNPEMTSYLYFPLCNDIGIKSSLTPELGGDMKMDQNSFSLIPVSSEDLHLSRANRNFWFLINGNDLWSITGASSYQQSLKSTDNKEETELEAGFLYHRLYRTSKKHSLSSLITSFVPSNNEPLEIHEFNIKNIGSNPITLEPTSAIPLYGRSADNIRDHRHVTSLLAKAKTYKNGISLKPTLSFDERGHKINKNIYGVFGAGNINGKNIPINGYIPTIESFISEGGSLDNPLSLYKRDKCIVSENTEIDGYETMGSICFDKITLEPNQEATFYIGIYITSDNDISIDEKMTRWQDMFCNNKSFKDHLEKTKSHWEEKVNVINISTSSNSFDNWIKWVNIQPVLRRIYGCSFLPHHDYGKGGRGWRDLWQDSLALLFMEPKDVRYLLYNNFAGVRIDGSNATIIGVSPGQFIADRNNIPRNWMDHGAWPWLTTKEYIHQTGDIDFLFEKQSYFKDALCYRSKRKDEKWNQAQGNMVKDTNGNTYEGSILEHLLLQNMSIYYNVGSHNVLKLEDADWNDALDMASENGESVAFTFLYLSNLKEISKMLKYLEKERNLKNISLLKEIAELFVPINNENIHEKRNLLNDFFRSVKHQVSGRVVELKIDEIYKTIDAKTEWMENHLRSQEFITSKEGYSWFNSYYDNRSKKVEGDNEKGVRIMLTGQVFALMGKTADTMQAQKIVESCNHYLKDLSVGGYRLNTNFNELKKDLGRGFGFAYGHKENGAMFSHMAIMYANALYKNGFNSQAKTLIYDMFNHVMDFERSRIYPSIPEYINERGRGMYTYLTGSASWLIYTIVTQMFGLRGYFGDLLIDPNLTKDQFKDNKAIITLLYRNKPLTVKYELSGNSSKLKVKEISPHNKITYKTINDKILIPYETIHKLQNNNEILNIILE